MREVNELIDKIEIIQKKKLFVKSPKIKKAFDYQKTQEKYYGRELDNLTKKIKESFLTRQIQESSPTFKKFREINKLIQQKSPQSLEKSKILLKDLYKNIPEAPKKLMKFKLPLIPKVIEPEVKSNLTEAEMCYNNNCYRSVLMLCAKILEIALHRKYYDITNKDMLEKAPDLTLGNLIKRIKAEGFHFDPGLSNQISLINQLRIHSVHKKQIPLEPSRDQALATIHYTLDTLKRLFK
ncbi:MAG: hypothetical protein JSW08_03510 [archaeon]|nr:MAG: hypothetical protein JSW08_03510 [archaeon]